MNDKKILKLRRSRKPPTEDENKHKKIICERKNLELNEKTVLENQINIFYIYLN